MANATLHIYIIGTQQRPPPIFYIEFYKIVKTNEKPDLPATAPVIARKIQQPTGEGDWVQLDITPVVSEWFKSPRENVGFFILGAVNGTKLVNTDLKLDDGSKVLLNIYFIIEHFDNATVENKRNV